MSSTQDRLLAAAAVRAAVMRFDDNKAGHGLGLRRQDIETYRVR